MAWAWGRREAPRPRAAAAAAAAMAAGTRRPRERLLAAEVDLAVAAADRAAAALEGEAGGPGEVGWSAASASAPEGRSATFALKRRSLSGDMDSGVDGEGGAGWGAEAARGGATVSRSAAAATTTTTTTTTTSARRRRTGRDLFPALGADGEPGAGGQVGTSHAQAHAPAPAPAAGGSGGVNEEVLRRRSGVAAGGRGAKGASGGAGHGRWGAVLALATLCRVALLCWGEFQDATMRVKYTDVDYAVFTDGAAHLVAGRTPYARATYRYPPILAALLVPNVLVHPMWGKAMFSACDLLVGSLIRRILLLRGHYEGLSTRCACLWLFNPYTLPIGTRGNCEPLVSSAVLAFLFLIVSRRLVRASCVFGLVVHFRLYPVLYALPTLVFLDERYVTGGWTTGAWAGRDRQGSGSAGAAGFRRLQFPGRVLARKVGLNPARLVFAVVSFAVFCVLTAASYWHSGEAYLREGVLYHLTRTDHRHNFSVWFLSLYLTHGKPTGLVDGLVSFVPQAVLLVAFARWFGRDLPLCLFLQTAVFVAFNKVCTAQYFVWYFCLLPLLAPYTALSPLGAAAVFGVWAGAQLHWLAWAYTLEFLGWNTYLGVWAASLAFFAAHLFAIVALLWHHRFCPVFAPDGAICRLHAGLHAPRAHGTREGEGDGQVDGGLDASTLKAG